MPPPMPTMQPQQPSLPPPSFNNCQADPNAAIAPNNLVQIVNVDKGSEQVRLKNVSPDTLDLTSWHMCSIRGNQEHSLSGILVPGEVRDFPGPTGNIWNNSDKDDRALYNPQGQLVSYWSDPGP